MYPGNWKMDSGVVGRKRSTELKAVDTALTTFDRAKNRVNLETLVDAILDWQGTKTPWTASIRKNAMVKLINYAKTEGSRLIPGQANRIFNRRVSERARDRMLQNPESFLARNRISIAGTGDGPANCYMFVESLDFLYGEELLRPDHITYPIVMYKINTDFTWGARINNAVSIKMHKDVTQQTNAANIGGKLYPLGGHEVVLTGMLTACTFVVSNNGGIGCTHLQPWAAPGGRDGNDLQDHVGGLGLNNVSIFGKRDYKGAYNHVIGFNRGGWTIYVQGANQNSIGGLDEIYPRRRMIPLV